MDFSAEQGDAATPRGDGPVGVMNALGRSSLVLVCEHASNYVPVAYARLGLSKADLRRHIAWDIGALSLAQHLSVRLDAPLVFATHSRLLLDLNRAPDAEDSIVKHSDQTPIPGNAGLSSDEREHRRRWLYDPFHRRLGALLAQRLRMQTATTLLSVHSFTPIFQDQPRPWHVGVVSNRDRRLADPLLSALRTDETLCVGDNEPYSGIDGVYHTMNLHAERQGLASVLLEVRNDLISDAAGRLSWARRLSSILNAEVLAQATSRP